MLEGRVGLRDKVLVGRVGGGVLREEVEDGRPAESRVGRVTRLGNEVLDNVVEGGEVVGVGLAELEKVERRARAQGRL
jgi:hypothetical protein